METTIQSYFWPVFWACIFGAILLVGLLMEALADKKSFKTKNSFRRCHSVKKWGEKLVIVGVCGEVIIAGLTAIRERKNDPLNRSVISISAHVQFTLASNIPTTNNGFTQVTQPSNCAELALGRYGTNGFIAPFSLVADKFDKAWYSGPGPGYWVDLRWSPAFRDFGRIVQGMPIKDLEAYFNAGILSVSFLPFDSDIEGGSGIITLNSSLEYKFVIPKQKMMGPTISCIFTNAQKH